MRSAFCWAADTAASALRDDAANVSGSSTTSGCPAATRWPGVTSTCVTRPCVGTPSDATCPACATTVPIALTDSVNGCAATTAVRAPTTAGTADSPSAASDSCLQAAAASATARRARRVIVSRVIGKRRG
ncbi:hypothetical protein J421_1962 [Gemmatirosa kalamazoonensis]|uniref:Uncharacterized protein n=1 Tax=Gemmatirosa kalamazoonensis TaxID=861299 RepID=W0REF8_9BACT|nr:hypothetical protein [Gemmatirosa kalamazoonensis]AHG89499.1 hypothetical protein J421_1962 [Gemmatirosa kalamazoonensis]